MNAARIGEIDRRLANLVRPGTVLSVDLSTTPPTVKVAIGRNITASLPFATSKAGDDTTWHPLEVGEQVMVFSPSGELSQGIVFGGIFQTSKPPPLSSPDQSGTFYKDGGKITYDRAAHAYAITLPSGGAATIKAGTNAQLVVENGDVTLSFGTAVSLVVNSSGITMTAGGNSIQLTSSGITTIGNISQTGAISATGDISSGSVTLKTHVHPGVQTGSGSTAIGVG